MKIQLSEKYNSAIPQILLFKKIEDLKEFNELDSHIIIIGTTIDIPQ